MSLLKPCIGAGFLRVISVYLYMYKAILYSKGMKTSHLTALRALEATLRTGNFRSAAAELGVTAAAVGQQVGKLEEFIGQKLFTRTPTGVQPTEYADRIAERLTSSFLTISDILEDLRQDNSKDRLAITISEAMAETWLSHRLPRFYELGIATDFHIDTSDRFVNLFTENFDLALRYGPAPSDDYDDTPLFGAYVLPICSPQFAKTYALSADHPDLKHVPVLHLHNWTTDPDWIGWEEWGEKYGIQNIDSERGIRYTEMSFGLQSAISGNGLVLCGFIEAHLALQDGRLVAPFGNKFITKVSYQFRLIGAKGRRKSEIQKTFEGWIIEEAELFRSQLKEFVPA